MKVVERLTFHNVDLITILSYKAKIICISSQTCLHTHLRKWCSKQIHTWRYDEHHCFSCQEDAISALVEMHLVYWFPIDTRSSNICGFYANQVADSFSLSLNQWLGLKRKTQISNIKGSLQHCLFLFLMIFSTSRIPETEMLADVTSVSAIFKENHFTEMITFSLP